MHRRKRRRVRRMACTVALPKRVFFTATHGDWKAFDGCVALGRLGCVAPGRLGCVAPGRLGPLLAVDDLLFVAEDGDADGLRAILQVCASLCVCAYACVCVHMRV